MAGVHFGARHRHWLTNDVSLRILHDPPQGLQRFQAVEAVVDALVEAPLYRKNSPDSGPARPIRLKISLRFADHTKQTAGSMFIEMMEGVVDMNRAKVGKKHAAIHGVGID